MRVLKVLLPALMFAGCIACFAQSDDPVIMTINGKPVLRSEFEYSYNKNNTEGVIDRKTVEEYVDLFVNYKLKVEAALDARMDTLPSFKREFRGYRNQQIVPSFVTDEAMEMEARRIYANTKQSVGDSGLILPSHILIAVAQDATQAEQDAAKMRIDSIYDALVNKGADFAELAGQLSQDPGSARKGGKVGWLQTGQTLKEFEDAAFALSPGEMSAPVHTPAGWHIIYMNERKQLEPYDTLRGNIIKMLQNKGQRRVAYAAIDSIAAESNGALTRDDVIEQRASEMCAADRNLDYLVREYHDGLLLYEISNREVWDKAAKDKEGLAAYFDKNKKKYAWDEPRYKGIAYHTKTEADIDAVRECVKDADFSTWGNKLRSTFNTDTIIRIRAEKGIFKKGDNVFIDQMVFNVDTVPASIDGFPYNEVYGKVLKKGPECYEDVRGLVVADYQEELEKAWVASLRQRYQFTVNDDVVATVNKHDANKGGEE